MDFDILDRQMRGFEQSLDRCMTEGIYVVARLDGHGFTSLTKKEWDLERPFDVRFKDAMVECLRRLMDCGFKVIYGYTQSDEISLLFHHDDKTFGRKERKLISLLAAEASVAFSFASGRRAVFDCRLVPLPDADNVVDYFRWRQEDCHRNSLHAHCYWLLREKGMSPSDTQAQLADMSTEHKIDLLHSYGIDFNSLPSWQVHGQAMYYQLVERQGYNPKTKETTTCQRRVLTLDSTLPTGQQYSEMIMAMLRDNA